MSYKPIVNWNYKNPESYALQPMYFLREMWRVQSFLDAIVRKFTLEVPFQTYMYTDFNDF